MAAPAVPLARLRALRRVAALLPCLALAACDGSAPAALAPPRGLVIVDPPNPELPWDYDLGVVPYGDTVDCVVRLRNDEGRPLTIRTIQSACSCTTAAVSYVDERGERVLGRADAEPALVVPAGATAELLLASDTRLVPVQNAAKRVRVVVTTDSASNPYVAIEVHLIVELAFQAVPGTLRLGDVAENEGARARTTIVALGAEGREVAGVERASPGVLATVERDDGVLPAQWTLAVELAAPIARGPIDAFVELATTGPRGEGRGAALRVPIAGNGVPDFEIRPPRLVFLGLETGTASEVELISHLAGERLRVLAIRPDDGAEGLIWPSAEPVAADDSGRSARWIVRAHLGARAPGELAGALTIETDGRGEIELPYAIGAARRD